MQSDASRFDWLLSVSVVGGITAWRLLTLAFDRTDLFVDEAQYWFWGQNLDWGYYSKPPMIAWLSRLVTDLAGSDATFWVRAPGSVLHAVTAVLTGLLAARLFGSRIGLWAAVLYVTTPFAILGSWLYSTDTVLLPFFAGALLAYVHLTERSSPGWAIGLGLLTGFGFLSKYAMLYFPLTAALAAIFVPRARIAWRDAGIATLAALLVAAPNLLWNIQRGGSTIRHVAVENARLGQSHPDLGRGLEFLASQFGVFGPILFTLLLLALWRSVRHRATTETTWLLILSLPVVFLMTFQAIRANAYANWAVTGYVAGTVLAAALLVRDYPRLRRASLGLHLALAVAFPLLYVFPEALRLPNGDLIAARYLGQSDLSRQIVSVAREEGMGGIVAEERAVLADLFYTARGETIPIRAVPPSGPVGNYYEQSFALDPAASAPLLYVQNGGSLQCPDGPAKILREFTPSEGVYRGRTYRMFRVDGDCLSIWRPT